MKVLTCNSECIHTIRHKTDNQCYWTWMNLTFKFPTRPWENKLLIFIFFHSELCNQGADNSSLVRPRHVQTTGLYRSIVSLSSTINCGYYATVLNHRLHPFFYRHQFIFSPPSVCVPLILFILVVILIKIINYRSSACSLLPRLCQASYYIIIISFIVNSSNDISIIIRLIIISFAVIVSLTRTSTLASVLFILNFIIISIIRKQQ